MSLVKGKFSLSIKRKSSKSKVSMPVVTETSKSCDSEITNTLLSRNLKHLSFIEELEILLGDSKLQHTFSGHNLEDVRRMAQINTLKSLSQYKKC